MSKNDLTIITLNKPYINDFSIARNELLKKAKTEWVLFLDSDEALSKSLKREILKSIREPQNKQIQGYYVLRKNYFRGQYIGTDKILRLVKKNSGRWVRAVHEVFVPFDKSHPRGVIRSPLIHNAANNLRDYITKINFYSSLHAQANKREGKKPTLFKIIIYPKVKFVQSLLMGRGVVFSILQAFHSFLAWSELWILQRG